MVSSAEFDDGDVSQATNATQSDVFYSIRNSTLRDDDDNTMRTENGIDDDEITLDIDTPDDMEDSIMGRKWTKYICTYIIYTNLCVVIFLLTELESLATSPQDGTGLTSSITRDPDAMDESMRWKPYRVGPADVQIDLQAIQVDIYTNRKCGKGIHSNIFLNSFI